jgi:putative DNA primase/helicase
VAGSVFGRGDIRNGGYVQTWRATANGLEAVAAMHNDTLLCLDELKQVDAREAGEIAYMLANGSGKSRADRMGLAWERQTWRVLFLSSGEVSLADHLNAAGKRVHAGEETRLADIPADTQAHGAFEDLHGYPNGEAFSRALKEAAQRYYGTAAREFVRRLQAADPTGGFAEKLRRDLEALRREFLAYYVPEGASGQVQRVALRFTLVAFGGELATRLGLTSWPQGEAINASVACFNAWLTARGGIEDQEIQAALSQVRKFFELHRESRFTPWDMALAGESRTINRAGFRRDKEDGTEFYVLPEVFKQEICGGFDSRFVARLLVERGLLTPGKDGKPAALHRLPGMGPKKTYVIKPFTNE